MGGTPKKSKLCENIGLINKKIYGQNLKLLILAALLLYSNVSKKGNLSKKGKEHTCFCA